MGAGYEAIPAGIEWMFEIDISEEDKIAIAEILSSIKKKQDVIFFVSNTNCLTCGSASKFYKKFLEIIEYVKATNLVRVSKYSWDDNEDRKVFHKYNIERVPTIALAGGSIKYVGLPTGEEFPGFLETVSRIGSGDYGLSQQTLSSIEDVQKRINIKVLVTPTCPYCPYAALISNMFALASRELANGEIVSEIVEVYENPDLAEKYGVMSVPTVVINDEIFQIGVPSEELMVQELLR